MYADIQTPKTTPDFAGVKEKQRAAWGSGDYAVVGTTLQIVGENLCEALDLRSGSRVLDVAAGNGNATLAAARRFCDVTSTDYVPALLAKGRDRSVAEGLPVRFQVADVEDLPFEDASFDVVLSTFGVMFTPDQFRAAGEMQRVVRPGGRVGMANWTPDGFIGQVFRTLAQHVPPAPGLRSPALWGTSSALKEMFGPQTTDISVRKRDFVFRYRSFEHFLDVFRTYYGPLHKAFMALGDKGAELEADLANVVEQFNLDRDGGFVVPSEYAEVIVTK